MRVRSSRVALACHPEPRSTLFTWWCIGLLIVGVLAAPRVAQAGFNLWTTAGPQGGHIYALVVDPKTTGVVYATSTVGMFKSATGGSIWAEINSGLTGRGVVPSPFTFQAVDPATDQPVAPLNTPVDIAPANSQRFLVTLTPSAAVCPTDVQFGFNCSNTGLADILTGRNTLLLSAGSTAGCGLSASAATSQASFVPGQTLFAGGSVTNSGLPRIAADFYVGLFRPDRSIQFVTPAGLVVGNVSDLRSFRSLATNVSLTTPFSVSQSSIFTHQWTADDVRGPYTFFVLAVKTNALAGGTLANDQVLRVATAPFALQ